MRWLFYCSADKKCFILTYNHSVWPRHFSVQDKINLSPNDFVEMSCNGRSYKCSLVKSGTVAEVCEAQRKTFQPLNDAEHTLSFIDLDESTQEPVAQGISSNQNVFDDALMDKQSLARSPAHGKGKKKVQPTNPHGSTSDFAWSERVQLPRISLDSGIFSQKLVGTT